MISLRITAAITQSPQKTMVQIRGRPATWVDRFVRPAHWLRIKSDQINCEFDSVRIASGFVACI
jgi:hypothetical protein